MLPESRTRESHVGSYAASIFSLSRRPIVILQNASKPLPTLNFSSQSSNFMVRIYQSITKSQVIPFRVVVYLQIATCIGLASPVQRMF